MRLTDKLVNRVGSDKLLHYLVSGWAVSSSSLYGFKVMLIMILIILILSVLKEMLFDERCEWMDALWAMYGCLTSMVLYCFYLFVK